MPRSLAVSSSEWVESYCNKNLSDLSEKQEALHTPRCLGLRRRGTRCFAASLAVGEGEMSTICLRASGKSLDGDESLMENTKKLSLRPFWATTVILVLAACSAAEGPQDEAPSVVDSQGGELRSADGLLSLTIPAGALEGPTDIRIARAARQTFPDVVSSVYELSPHGLRFSKPITIKLRLEDADQGVRLANLDDQAPEFLLDSHYDSTAQELRASLEHFSRYGAVRGHYPCRQLSCGDSCRVCARRDRSCREPSRRYVCSPMGRCLPEADVRCGQADAGIVNDAGVGIPQLTAKPDELRLRTIDLDCASGTSTKTVVFKNVGTVAAHLDSIEFVSGRAGFRIDRYPPLRSLAPGDEFRVSVSFTSTVVGNYQDQLVLSAGSIRAAAKLHGRVTARVRKTQYIPQKRRADVLLVIDSSCGSGAEQEALSADIAYLIHSLGESAVDYQIGVTTLDTSDRGEKGQLLGQPAVIKPSTHMGVSILEDRVEVGTSGWASETGLEAIRLSLDLVQDTGLFRADAWTNYIILSDEEDQSPLGVIEYIDIFTRAKRYQGRAETRLNFIGGGDGMVCRGVLGAAQSSPRYHQAVRWFGGVAVPVCEAGYRAAVTDLGPADFGLTRVFVLAESAAEIYSVKVRGRTIPSANYDYDSELKAVVFKSGHRPDDGERVTVDYRVSCQL